MVGAAVNTRFAYAGEVLACDFFIVVTAAFQRVSVFLILDITTRRVMHWNLTRHPTAEWTIQQFRNGISAEGAHRFLVRDRDAILAPAVDAALRSMRLRVLRTPGSVPQANAHCEAWSVRPDVSVWIGSFRSTSGICGARWRVDHALQRRETAHST